MFVFASSKTCLDAGCSCLLPRRHVWILDVRALLPQRVVWIMDVRVCFLKGMFGYRMFVFASSKTCLDTGCSCLRPQ
jgi:hypothetical protein